MPDILAMLTHERDKLNRAIEALGDTVGHAVIKRKQTRRENIRYQPHLGLGWLLLKKHGGRN